MKKSSRIERLAQKEEKDVIKRIIYLSLFSFLLIIFLFTVGISLLGRFADFLNVIFKKTEVVNNKEGETPRPPIIDSLPAATNSAQLDVAGFAAGVPKVYLYLNDEKMGESGVKNGKFNFDDLILKTGENSIAAKSISDKNKESDFSESLIVILDTQKPTLAIETPTDNQSFSGNNRIKVSGKTDGDTQVYANGFLANVSTDGKFEVLIPAPEGESEIEIKAIDQAGNTTTEKRKVSFKK